MKEYKNGYLLTDEEHDYAIKHKHQWVERSSGHVSADCECGAMKLQTQFGERIYISFAPNRHARSLIK